jgi:hypothetical protein
MTVITLVGHVVNLVPPQQILMLEVTSVRRGDSAKLLHSSGHESDGQFKLLSRSTAQAAENGVGANDEVVPLPFLSQYFAALPLLANIDLWKPPPGYGIIPEKAIGRFEFTPGEEYAVVMLSSGVLMQVSVRATQ